MEENHWSVSGKVYINGKQLRDVKETSWQKHAQFEGVFIKPLFAGADANNQMSAMIVRIEPNKAIGDHVHEGKAELHEVVEGFGIAKVGNISVEYKPGVYSLIPADVEHNIHAGAKGMILLAKFTPPLN